MEEKSMANLSNDGIKMAMTSASDLHVSVSFGRFENDLLSWERWSTFSPNKYLEEVEKCATPGSVAKKAAYFEAHYRKIAAKKAEVSARKHVEDGSLHSSEGIGGDLSGKTCENESEVVVNVNDNGNIVEEVKQEIVVVGQFIDYAGERNEEVKQEEIVVDDQCTDYAGERNEEVKREETVVDGQFTEYIGEHNEEVKQEQLAVDSQFTDYAGEHNEEVKQEILVDGQFTKYIGEHNEEVKQEHLAVDSQFTNYAGEHNEDVKQEIVVDSQFRDHAADLMEEALAMNEGGTVVVEAQEENEGIVDVFVVSKLEEAAMPAGKGEDTPSAVGSPTIKELPETKSFTEDFESSLIKKDESAHLNHEKVSPKVNLTSKIRDTKGVQTRDAARVQKKPVSPSKVQKKPVSPVTRVQQKPVSPVTRAQQKPVPPVTRVQKKPVSPVTKAPHVSATIASKPASPSISTPSRPSTKNLVGLSSPRSKIAPIGDNKKVSPRSLHMSINFEGPKSDPGHLTSTRKPLIMEKMGDKDIVKRAFRTFQNNFNQSANMNPIGAKQIPSRREVKAPATTTPRKDNTGLTKSVFADKRTAKAAPSASMLKSDAGAAKKKELPKKSDDKSNAKMSPHIKSTEEKEEEQKKLGQKLNLKTSPKSGSCRVQKFSKSPMDKVPRHSDSRHDHHLRFKRNMNLTSALKVGNYMNRRIGSWQLVNQSLEVPAGRKNVNQQKQS